jgi:ABC-type uncharacterized transport system auxiliary subunit
MIRLIFIVFIALFIMTSCGSQKVITTKYYVIEINDDSLKTDVANKQPVIDKYCEIEPVDVYPAYASTQIANRGKTKEITYYAYHQWAIRPTESFTRIILDYFMHTPIFKSTAARFWRVDPVYKVETVIYNLEVIQENNSFTAHLDVEFRLMESEEGIELLHHRADRRVELKDKDINLLASAIADIFYGELIIFSDKIVEEIPRQD